MVMLSSTLYSIHPKCSLRYTCLLLFLVLPIAYSRDVKQRGFAQGSADWPNCDGLLFLCVMCLCSKHVIWKVTQVYADMPVTVFSATSSSMQQQTYKCCCCGNLEARLCIHTLKRESTKYQQTECTSDMYTKWQTYPHSSTDIDNWQSTLAAMAFCISTSSPLSPSMFTYAW